MFGKKVRSGLAAFLFIFLLVISLNRMEGTTRSYPDCSSRSGVSATAQRSKAEIVGGLKNIIERIEESEKNQGLLGTAGFKVYSPEETGDLLEYYRTLQAGLEFLNRGCVVNIKDWQGYSLDKKGREAYSRKEAFQIMTELEETNLPSAFLSDLRIYLLPYGVPEISGLGSAGYVMVSAPNIQEKSIEQLRVTLLHEIGHHIHSSFMPAQAGQINPFWEAYHGIRGGQWQGPGGVNTTAWSSSSEENFAEDFRMLFGKEQWYYGDMDLGDPREQPKVAAELKQFMIGLKDNEKLIPKRSPWVPEGLHFWLNCSSYIAIGWTVLAVGVVIVLKRDKFRREQVTNNNCYYC